MVCGDGHRNRFAPCGFTRWPVGHVDFMPDTIRGAGALVIPVNSTPWLDRKSPVDPRRLSLCMDVSHGARRFAFGKHQRYLGYSGQGNSGAGQACGDLRRSCGWPAGPARHRSDRCTAAAARIRFEVDTRTCTGTSDGWLAILLRQGFAGQVRSSEPCFAKATQGMLRSPPLQGSERSMAGRLAVV